MVLRTLLYITPRNISDLTVVNETTEETMIISESPDYDECDLFYLADSDIITISAPGYRTITNTAEYFSDNPYVNLEQILEVANLSKGGNTYQIKAKTVENTNGGSVKIWTGTQAQYNAIATKDSNTLYNITDDVSVTQTILETLYPVGSLYIGKMSTCPLASLIPNSTWTLVASDKVLQGSGTYTAGTSVNAGLPNISGHFIFADNIVKNTQNAQYVGEMVGCFTGEDVTANTCSVSQTTVATVSSHNRKIKFSADSSNSIYGASNTVQPPAYVVNIWERTA